jgi:Zn-dependent protease with chaperone function
MNIAAGLLVYSLAVLLAGPPVLRALTTNGHVPRLGVAAWVTAIASVVAGWLAAVAMLIFEVIGHWHYPQVFVASCLNRLHGVVSGHAGLVSQIMLVAIAAPMTTAAAIGCVQLARTVLRMRARAHDHARAVRLVGHRMDEANVVVVEAAQPAAYCVSGRPSAIVVTSAALAALDERQLAAVVAHERAHLTGHHSLIVTGLRGLAAVFPRLALFSEGLQHVSRLLEMCADDAAVRRHDRRVLLTGLVTLCRAAPAEALAAADLAVLARAERLAAAPGDPAAGQARAALASLVALLAAGPLITVALAASGALMCGM